MEAAGHAADCAVTLLVQEHPVAVLRRRRVEVAADHAVREGGHMSVAVAFAVGLAVCDHVQRHIEDLMVLLEVHRGRTPIPDLR